MNEFPISKVIFYVLVIFFVENSYKSKIFLSLVINCFEIDDVYNILPNRMENCETAKFILKYAITIFSMDLLSNL